MTLLRQWWHCLLRFHRMVTLRQITTGKLLYRGCADCDAVFFGDNDMIELVRRVYTMTRRTRGRG